MLSAFRKRNVLLLMEEGEAKDRDGSRRGLTTLQLCLRCALVSACVTILFLGLAVTAIGAWGYSAQQDYLAITDRDSQLTRLPYTMMVTGGFVALLGLLGVAGSLFSGTMMGQTLLGVFSFVLVLVIVSELGAGAAAVKLKFELETVYVEAATRSQEEYETDEKTAENWNKFQQDHECCGARGYVDDVPPYYNVFKNESVPVSCCNSTSSNNKENCPDFALNATLNREHIYQQGCPVAVVGNLTNMVVIVAVVAIAMGGLQLMAVLLAVIVAYVGSKLSAKKNRSYSYKQLLQQEENNSRTVPNLTT